MRLALALILIGLATVSPAARAAAASVFLEELTWTELRDAVRAGSTTAIIPVGGTEQSGPHLALGKHNVRVKLLAGRIAAALGNTIVAPVLAYVPEGAVAPPTSHMRYPGTISLPDDTFKSVLDAAARSLRQGGFTDVVLIGDHGGYQAQLKAVAARLNRDWAATPARAHFVAAYYDAAQAPYAKALRAKGFTDAQIGSHAGLADTSLMLATDPALVRPERMPRDAADGAPQGVAGDPRGASAALGQIGVDAIVANSVAAIRAALSARP